MRVDEFIPRRETSRRSFLKYAALGASIVALSPAEAMIASSAKSVSVGLTTSIAGLGDQGFNDLAALGVHNAVRLLGIKGTVVEAHAETDYVPDLQGFASDGYSLMYAVGFLMQDALHQVAAQYKHSKFAIIDAIVPLPNVSSNTFREEQGSYLAGAFAAMMTLQRGVPKMQGTKILGFIGGGDVPLIHKFQHGFQQGVAKIDPRIKVLVSYAGSFTDPAKGKELALSQYNQGADIVYQAAGPTGTGVIEAAQQLDRYVIGVDADQNHVAPHNVITSMQKHVEVAVYRTIRSVVDGTFRPGVNVFGIDNGGIGLAPFHGLSNIVPAHVKATIAELTAQIKSGQIKVRVDLS